jgi:hypothetical protein
MTTHERGRLASEHDERESAMVSEQTWGVFEVLLATSWPEKCEIAGQYAPYLPGIRETLQEEADLALQRGDTDDAVLFAAHVSLLDEIERCGVAFVQAQIAQATQRREHRECHDADDYSGSVNR